MFDGNAKEEDLKERNQQGLKHLYNLRLMHSSSGDDGIMEVSSDVHTLCFLRQSSPTPIQDKNHFTQIKLSFLSLNFLDSYK